MPSPLIIEPAAVDFTISVAPGRSYGVEMPGTFFRIVSTNAAFSLQIDSRAPVQVRAGDLYRSPGGSSFNRLVVLNRSTTDTLAVLLTVGQGDFIAANGAALPWPTLFLASLTTSLGAGAGITFDGVPSGSRIMRKVLTVSNRDASGELQFRDQAGNPGRAIVAGQTIAMEVSGFVQVFNATAAPIACLIGEEWFYNP